MGENIKAKSFTLRDVTIDDIDKFTDLKNSKRLTPGGTLNLLLNAFENTGAPSTSSEEIDKLKAEIAGLHKIIEGVNYENTELKEQIETLQNKTPETITKTIEVAAKITPPAFVFDPMQYDGLKKWMERCIAFDIKKGIANKANQKLPEFFTYKALTYYIKNEYNHILK